MNTDPGDQVPNRVFADHPFDDWLDLHLQDPRGDSDPAVQVILSLVDLEQTWTL